MKYTVVLIFVKYIYISHKQDFVVAVLCTNMTRRKTKKYTGVTMTIDDDDDRVLVFRGESTPLRIVYSGAY